VKFRWPWISRRDHELTVELFERFMGWDRQERDILIARIEYLERERETYRQASITNQDADNPITDLDHNEDIARWEGEGGA
jgi:hypothetical protein